MMRGMDWDGKICLVMDHNEHLARLPFISYYSRSMVFSMHELSKATFVFVSSRIISGHPIRQQRRQVLFLNPGCR